MSVLWIVLALVALQRIVALVYAQRNTNALLARGGIEIGASHYPLFVVLHAAWLMSMVVFIAPSTPPNWWLLASFALLQAARVWIVFSLGPYWTTRVITIPGEPLVRKGPYRLLRHPNYLVVVLEVAVLPLAFGSLPIAVVFTVLNVSLLAWRIHVENRALEPRRS